MKKVRIIALIFALVFIQSNIVFASNILEKRYETSMINNCKDIVNVAMGDSESFEISDFSEDNNLYIKMGIPVYESKENGIVNCKDVTFIPVVNNTEKMIGIIISTKDDNGNLNYEYNEKIAQKIMKSYTDLNHMSFILDKNHIWLKYNQSYVKILTYNTDIADRTTLNVNNNSLNRLTNSNSSIKTINLKTLTRDASTSKNLDVPVYLQSAGSSYCWACSAVSAGKYKKPNKNYTPEAIAREYAGNLTTPKPLSTVKTVLSEKYSVSSSMVTGKLKMSAVISKINANKPIIPAISYGAGQGGHAVVVSGYQQIPDSTSYVTIMDSLSGKRILSVAYSSSSDREVKYYLPGSTTKYNVVQYLIVG